MSSTVLAPPFAGDPGDAYLTHCSDCGWPLYRGDYCGSGVGWCLYCQQMVPMPEPSPLGLPIPGVPDPRSPVETMFRVAWNEVAPALATALIPQYRVPGTSYQADFALEFLWLLIEVDGAANHSSREDRQKDYKRERVCIELGWLPVRFTGVDVYHGARYCAEQALRIARNRAWQILKPSWKPPRARNDFTLGA